MPDTMIPESQTSEPTWQLTSRSSELGALFAAVAKAQGEIEGAKKDSTNPHFKSQYADLASARDAVQGPLSKNELALIQWPRTIENGVEIETWLGHSSGQYMSGTLCMPCGKMDAHGVGSAITYGRRYALMAVTGVAPIDDDGNGAAAGAPGTAGGGGQFRPAGRRDSSANGRSMAAAEPQLATTREKGKLPPGTGRASTVEEARAAKVKAAVDKRVKLLEEGAPWLQANLHQFWTDNEEWIDWMTDARNGALREYERFTTAYAAAEKTVQEVA